MTEPLSIKVELFGTARVVSGARSVEVEAHSPKTAGQLAALLARRYPELCGKVLRDDGSALLSSYTFNLNGVSFIDSEDLDINPGDSVLLFSSQAGG